MAWENEKEKKRKDQSPNKILHPKGFRDFEVDVVSNVVQVLGLQFQKQFANCTQIIDMDFFIQISYASHTPSFYNLQQIIDSNKLKKVPFGLFIWVFVHKLSLVGFDQLNYMFWNKWHLCKLSHFVVAYKQCTSMFLTLI